MIKSISYDQGELIRNILTLHVPSKKIDLDCTYSKGNFYKGTGVEAPQLKFDICPMCKGVIRADARHLPVEGNSIGCMIFDPPFLSSKGPSLNIDVKRTNIIAKRFGTYSTERELHQFYTDALQEAHRILQGNGILIFKCQDKVSSGKQYMTHCFVYNEAVRVGFYPKDLFVLLAKSRAISGKVQKQLHARKYHSYFWVFEKTSKPEPISDCLTGQ